MTDKENVITKTYDLLLYLIPQLAKFPRDQKFLLADRIENLLLDFLEAMIEAYYSREKKRILETSNLKLERLRYLIRLSFDLHLINTSRYEFLTVHIDEIGRMVGGWRKSLPVRS
ncbi:MAG TPA: diversity-generating retroelement protein Avd [bacterium]|nr:diversity-generating retroelement protein Avd [bacterium]